MGSKLFRFAALIISIIFGGAAFAGDAPMRLPVDPAALIVLTQAGDVSFDVEIAETGDERARGLMHRTDFPAGRAMLFDFGEERAVAMWMKNTPLSLDMLFADSSGAVTAVIANTVPQSTDVLSAGRPTRYVVELLAGEAARNGITAGATLLHPAIRP